MDGQDAFRSSLTIYNQLVIAVCPRRPRSGRAPHLGGAAAGLHPCGMALPTQPTVPRLAGSGDPGPAGADAPGASRVGHHAARAGGRRLPLREAVRLLLAGADRGGPQTVVGDEMVWGPSEGLNGENVYGTLWEIRSVILY